MNILSLFAKPQKKESQSALITTVSLPIVALVVLLFILILRRAWINDDAYITFRTIDNFINGYRLTWNTTERVQAYTHPLWMFLLSLFYFFTREIYLTSIFVSLAVSVAAVLLLSSRIAKSTTAAALGIVVLCLSNAYVDYSTSGLENPLTHLCLVCFYIFYFRYKSSPSTLLLLSLVASFAGLNRLDTLLFYIPALSYLFFQLENKKSGIFALLIGQLPLILWECFSILYYGFPFPNTAYAKLNTGIPSSEIVEQGFYYILNSLERDPITLAIILLGIVIAFIGKEKRNLSIAAGIVLYLLYVIKIGGDFMSGRYFTGPLLCAVILISRYNFAQLKTEAILLVFAVAAFLGLAAPSPTYTLNGHSTVTVLTGNGIVDERIWYFQNDALLRGNRNKHLPNSVGRQWGIGAKDLSKEDFFIRPGGNVGLYGYFGGPNVHIIDWFALTDPLLARIPPYRDVNWRIGHFQRIIPKGYVSTAYTGGNLLEDKSLAEYYDKLFLITQGNLFDRNRLIAIWEMNTGKYDYLIDFDAYRYPEMEFTDLSTISEPKSNGTRWNHPGNLSFVDSGVEINLEALTHAGWIEISLDSDDDYEIVYFNQRGKLAAKKIPATYSYEGLVIHRIQVPMKAAEEGYDRVRIFPLQGDSEYSLGHLILLD